MTITEELAKKVCLQYVGQKVMYGHFPRERKGTLDGYNEPFGFQVQDNGGLFIRHNVRYGLMKLILKPLSKITDEDKIALYHISSAEDKYDYTQDYNGIKSAIDNWIEKEGQETLFKTFRRYQYLQSKGYDLPQYLLGGKTLQESGLAIYND